MNRYVIGSLWDRVNRNGANANFKYLFEGRQKIDELNNRADNILDVAQQTNDMNVDVQNQVDDLILHAGESDAEVIQARGGLPLLKDRLAKSDAQLAEITTYVYLESFPKLPGENDDTERIKRAIASMNEGETLIAKHLLNPYYISDTILVDKKINMVFENDIVYQGVRNRPAMVLKGLEYNTVNFKKIVDIDLYPNYSVGYHGWLDMNYIGILTDNLKECDVNVEAIFGFTVGHKNAATRGGGNWFNRIRIKRLINNKIHLELNSDGVNSWMNSNIFMDYAPGYSGNEFITDVSEKYSILQTLTDRNIYGGNSNIFENFKFETRPDSPDNWTQIKLLKANDFHFKDYRYEGNKANSKFAIIDLYTHNPESSGVTHSSSNKFTGGHISGVGHELEFINTNNIKLPYSAIAYIDSEKFESIMSDYDLPVKYRRINNSTHVIKDYFRKPVNSIKLNEEFHYDYSTNDLRLLNGVTVSNSFPIVLYVSNLTVGDEIYIKNSSSNGIFKSPLYKAFDSNGDYILNGSSGGTPVIAIDGYFNTNTGGYVHNSGDPAIKQITVNHASVNTIAVLISGDLTGLNVLTNNNDIIIEKTKNEDYEKVNGFIHTGKPNMGDSGYWNYNEVVNNLNKELGQPIGWQYKGNGNWDVLPIRE